MIDDVDIMHSAEDRIGFLEDICGRIAAGVTTARACRRCAWSTKYQGSPTPAALRHRRGSGRRTTRTSSPAPSAGRSGRAAPRA